MIVTIIGTTSYEKKMEEHAKQLRKNGIEVFMPILDHHNLRDTSLAIIQKNADQIAQADEVHVFWDRRSPGAWGDICVAIALRKRIKIIFLERKSCVQALIDYVIFSDEEERG